MSAGRSCPLSYRYTPASMRGAASVATETLYVVGGLYGNQAALDAVLRMFEGEPGPKHLIFNGDFNWFNVSADSFERVNRLVLGYDAIRGNVETELAAHTAVLSQAGCGCAYPDWVEQEVVDRSNAIMQRLAQTAAAFPALQQRLSALPMYKRIEVGGLPVAVVHGDAHSLAGWDFAPEHLRDPAHRQLLASCFDAAAVRVFACSHTCSPALCPVTNARDEPCLIANNGAAGMPNFSGLPSGLLTRIATTPCVGGRALYGTQIDTVFIDALPIAYDTQRWHEEFLAQWPAGSAAHDSYWQRISQGPSYCIEQAFDAFT